MTAAMKFYQPGRPELHGCESTVKFIERIAELIHAFNSRTGKSAIRKENSPEKKVMCF